MSHSPVAAPEAKVEAVVQELAATPQADKRKLAVDQKLLLSEVQMLLAEKRTAFALLRTGVTVAMLPLSLLTVLVATSRLWNLFEVLWVLVPLGILGAVLFFLGMYLIWHAMENWRYTERVLAGLKKTDTLLEELMFHELQIPIYRQGRDFARRFRGET